MKSPFLIAILLSGSSWFNQSLMKKDIAQETSKVGWYQYHFVCSQADSALRAQVYQSGWKSHKCFPGYSEISFVQHYDSIRTQIFNREGEHLFNTTDTSENWICNSDTSSSIYPGSYYYMVTLYMQGEKDILKGSFHVINHK